jgi:ubiquinone/menaquinone biosynthesis C-methylase UbiE
MQKSLYQDKTFADYWNDRAGDDGEVYKRYVLDPLMFKLIGSLKGKVVIDLGCGNGYLAPKFIDQSPKRVVMMDISEHNLRHAAAKCDDPSVSFLQQDATIPWKVDSFSVDVIYSNMMLNEVEDIKTPIDEAFRTLKPGGMFIFSVTHPAWDLFIYAKEKAGEPSKKMKGLGGYFRRGYAKFVMGGDSRSNPALKEKYGQGFEVEHYQRPISDYFNQLVDAGFVVKRFLEPELTEELLQNNPGYSEYTDNPIGLVFYGIKA